MTELVSIVPAIEISTDTIVEIETALPNLQVNTSESITVEVQPDTYVLSSAGMYTGNMTGKIPTWILDAIQEQLTTGDGNISSVLDDIQLLLDGLQVGVNQAISQIENTNTSMSALETSLNSKIGANNAAILDVYATRVTPTEAQAIAVQAIGSAFNGNVDAYIGNLASAYTNATSAIATDIHTLQVSYNDQTARIDTVEEVSLSKNTTIRSAIAPTLITNPKLIIGDSWINTTNNVTKSWNGSSWVDTTNTNANQAYTWSATASKLITAPDGSVTGWSFGDGSNTQSNFKIKAENFSISDGTTGYTPFSITGSDINFLGKVSFSSVTSAPTSTPNSTFPGVSIGAGYTVTKAGVHVVYLYGTAATGVAIKVNGSTAAVLGELNKQVLVYATPSLSVGQVLTVTVSAGTSVAYVSNPDAIAATVPGTQWYIPAYSTTLVAGSNKQFVVGSSSAVGDVIKAINGNTNTTTIDGGKITTGSIRSNQMFANRLVNISAYNGDGSINESAVTMDINLGTGYIYIK